MTELEELEMRMRLQWVKAEEVVIELMEVISQSEAVRRASQKARIETQRAVSQSAGLRTESRERRNQNASRSVRR